MINLVLIGCGYWGANLARNLAAMHVLRYVCDKDKGKCDKLASKYNVIGYNDYKLIPLEDIDGVVIAVPPEYHYKVAEYFLLNDKHVFIEKPMTTSSRDADVIRSVASATNKVVMVGHIFLYTNEIRYIKKYIDSGKLGQIYSITTRRLNLGLVQSGCNVVWDLAPHDISVFNYLLQSHEPLKINGTISSFLGEKFEEEAFLSLTYKSELSERNVVCNMHLSWLAPKKVRDMVVVGSEGMLVYDMLSDNKVCIYDKSVELNDIDSKAATNYGTHLLSYRYGDMLAPYIDVVEPLRVELEEFVECITTGKKPLSDENVGRDVVAVLERINRLSGVL